MSEVEGARNFQVPGEAYDRFMGRFSVPLAALFADFCGLQPPVRFLDVGCGPGALTGVAVERLGAGSVAAVDPSPPFVAACRARHPGVDVREAPAEALPHDDDGFDAAAAQLVLHFVSDQPQAVREMARVVRPGGVVGACVWDVRNSMDLLRAVNEAIRVVDPSQADDDGARPFAEHGELTAVFEGAGLREVDESTLTVTAAYDGFEELWDTLATGVGPAGAFLATLSPERRDQVRDALHEQVGRPGAGFTLSGTARSVRGVVPG